MPYPVVHDTHPVGFVAGSLMTFFGSLVAQATPGSVESKGGLLVALTGLLTILLAVAKEYFGDRRNRREVGLAREHLRKRVHALELAHRGMTRWAMEAKSRHADLPEVPEFDLGDSDPTLPAIREDLKAKES